MRAGLISAAALAVAVLAAAAPAVAAADGPRFTATPATAAPGDTVTLRAFGCTGPATASAPGLFGTVALGPGGGQEQAQEQEQRGQEQVATVTVGRYAVPGVRHDVAFGCDAGQGTIPVAVEERGAAAPGTVRTGLGGGVTGPGSVKVVAVAALVGATGLVVVRRRRTAVR